MISPAIALALCCLLVAGALDFVLKSYSANPRSRGMLIFGVGVVWALLHAVSMQIRGVEAAFSESTLIYGAIAAVFVTLSNILLIESFTHLPVSLASTVYRLNTVPLVILAVLFLGEALSWFEIAGIAVAIVAVLLLHKSSNDQSYQSGFVWMIVCASVIRAGYGFTTKLGLQRSADADTMILIAAIGWCIGGPLYSVLRERGVRRSGADVVGYSVVAGILVFGVITLLTHALQLGDASIVVPISNMGFVAALGIAFATGLEAPTKRKFLGIGCAVIAIVLLSTDIG